MVYNDLVFLVLNKCYVYLNEYINKQTTHLLGSILSDVIVETPLHSEHVR